MSQKKRRVRARKVITSDGAAAVYLRTDKPPQGRAWCLQHVSTRNKTSSSTKVTFLVEGHGYEHIIDELDNPSANALIEAPENIWIYDDEQLAVKWEGTSSGDKIELFYSGYEMEVSDVQRG